MQLFRTIMTLQLIFRIYFRNMLVHHLLSLSMFNLVLEKQSFIRPIPINYIGKQLSQCHIYSNITHRKEACL